MNKDQTIGGAIFLICVGVAILYIATLFFPEWVVLLGLKASAADVRFWAIAVPVFLAFVAVMGIGAWIGWTMATTPPPKPIGEIATEIEEKSGEERETQQKTDN